MQNGGRQSGFSLIEALVTLAILSVGLMGLAFLQAQGMKLSTGAYARTQASILAGDIIDRMRLNSGNTDDYASSDSSAAAPLNCNVTSAPSAANDLDCWYERLQETLPGGDGQIVVNGNQVNITIEWRENSGGRQDDDFDTSTLTEGDLIQNVSMSVVL